jgi:hypothetical protein
MLIKKEIIPAFRNDEVEQFKVRNIECSISEIRVYKNNPFVKNNVADSHQFGFSLVAEDDQITYANSNTTNSILPASFLSKFGGDETPKIPLEKYESAFLYVI